MQNRILEKVIVDSFRCFHFRRVFGFIPVFQIILCQTLQASVPGKRLMKGILDCRDCMQSLKVHVPEVPNVHMNAIHKKITTIKQNKLKFKKVFKKITFPFSKVNFSLLEKKIRFFFYIKSTWFFFRFSQGLLAFMSFGRFGFLATARI